MLILKAFPPAKVIFTGIGVLLGVSVLPLPIRGHHTSNARVSKAAKDVRASHGAIIDLFERVESFFKRLEVYTQISLTTKMAEVLVKIVIELLSILSIATKEVKRRRASELSARYALHITIHMFFSELFSRKLLGRTDIEDALRRLDSLIQEEVQMAIVQTLKVATEGKDGNGVIDQSPTSH